MMGIKYRTILSRLTKLIGLSAGLATLLVVVNSTSSFAAERTWTDIGSLGYSTWAHDINDHGMVVGDSRLTGYEYHAFIWQDGEMRDIGTSGESSTARDVNNRGQVIGYRYPGDESIVFVWQDGQMQDLTPILGRASVQDINDHGQIVGTIIEGEDRTAYIYDTTSGDLTRLSGNHTDAYGINNHGQVVGSRLVDGYRQATLWSHGETINLGTVADYPNSVATHINDNGHIAGWLADGYYWTQRAFYWHDGTMQEIGPTPLGSWNIPHNINNHNQILGSHYEGDGEVAWPWLWENGKDELISTDDWQFGYGYGINNAGQIIVNADSHSYVSSATSIPPEPVTIDTIITKVNQWQQEGKLAWMDSVLMQAFLRQAKSQIEGDDIAAACLRLDIVIGQIDQLEQRGKLSSLEATELRNDVQSVALSIDCQD